MNPAIEVEDLTVAYHEKPVLWDVDLSVPPGVLMAIVGPNGAGKTTLLKAILGLVPIAAARSPSTGALTASSASGLAMCPNGAAWTGIFPPACSTW